MSEEGCLPASMKGMDNENEVEAPLSALSSAQRLTWLTSSGPSNCKCLELEDPLLSAEDSAVDGVNSRPFFVEDSEKSDGPMVMKFEKAVKLSDIIVVIVAVAALGISLSLSRL